MRFIFKNLKITIMALTFKTLSENFEKVMNLNIKELGEFIGGKVQTNIDSGTFTNGCAIRMSYAFNYSGVEIPKSGYGATSSGRDGKWYLYRVADMINFVKAKIGGTPLVGTAAADFKGKKGVIIFSGCGWTDATGHVDLFDGTKVMSDNGNYFGTCSKAELYVIS